MKLKLYPSSGEGIWAARQFRFQPLHEYLRARVVAAGFGIFRALKLNVERGTAKRAKADGIAVGGKTGTAEKAVNGRYKKSALLTSFLGTFPMDDPRYIVLVVFDEPKPSKETHGYATSGWNAAPAAGRVIRRIAPMLGILPRLENTNPLGEAMQEDADPEDRIN